MHQTKTRRCDDRIVSISQPHVRPIVRGKLNKPVEFGAKLSVSLTNTGLAHVDHLRWDAFHEGQDLESQVESYYKRQGHYPESVLADPLYGTRANRKYLKAKGIRFAGKPLGRPKKATDANRAELKQQKAQRREDYRQRIPIEGKFGPFFIFAADDAHKSQAVVMFWIHISLNFEDKTSEFFFSSCHFAHIRFAIFWRWSILQKAVQQRLNAKI